MSKIKSPERLVLIDGGAFVYGGDQEWYSGTWQRKAGCGPTVASHLVWYMAHTRPEAGPLCPYRSSAKEDFLRLMEEIWEFVTPGGMGVNNTKIFVDGLRGFAHERSVGVRISALEIPAWPGGRPAEQVVDEFLTGAFESDEPVAFLNLSNGDLQNLDNWHWVTLVGFDPGSGTAVMYDQRKETGIDLRLWLRTTKLGGGFVRLSVI